eukprot:scaffold387_cov244-Pinguiococcus_pyrenoidosus.AAC.14
MHGPPRSSAPARVHAESSFLAKAWPSEAFLPGLQEPSSPAHEHLTSCALAAVWEGVTDRRHTLSSSTWKPSTTRKETRLS